MKPEIILQFWQCPRCYYVWREKQATEGDGIYFCQKCGWEQMGEDMRMEISIYGRNTIQDDDI